MYSQTTSSALKGAIQLGIAHTVGSLSQKAERDVLMQDFVVVESIFFPRLVGENRAGWKVEAARGPEIRLRHAPSTLQSSCTRTCACLSTWVSVACPNLHVEHVY